MSSVIRFHYDPFAEFDRLFDDAFNARLRPSAPSAAAGQSAPQRVDTFRPRLDLYETENSDLVTAAFELPGLKSEDVIIDVHRDRLTISGASASSHGDGEGRFAIRERSYGKFSRTLQLPVGTKAEDVKAKMENGVLTVTFPKIVAEQQPERIVIQ